MVVVVAGLAAVLGFALGAGSADEATPQARVGDAAAGAAVQVEYPEVPARWRDLQAEVRDSGVLEDAAQDLTSSVALPEALTVEVTSCDDGTGYLQGEALVEMCLQDLATTREELEQADVDDVDATVRGIWRETFAHEAGHAVIDLLDLPFTGREEDVADQFAAWRLAESGDEEDVDALLSSALEYSVLASAYEADPNDEHASDAARAVNYLCYVYGSDPDAWGQLVDDEPLTQERADQCPDEWEQLRLGWRELLADAGALRG